MSWQANEEGTWFGGVMLIVLRMIAQLYSIAQPRVALGFTSWRAGYHQFKALAALIAFGVALS